VEKEKNMYPEELKYSPEHFWLKSEKNDTVKIGITDYYRAQLQKIVFIELPEVGASLKRTERFGSIETAKAIEDVVSPISGKVVAINQRLATKPELITEDPYESGWLAIIEIADISGITTLLSAGEYEAMVKALPQNTT
jgi:glycine cleavage system H protein